MMRTVEVLIVIILITGTFITSSYFAVLPWPRQVSPVNLRRLALTTLQILDSNYDLSRAAFDVSNESLWACLHVALSASLPPNVLYNLTIYEVDNYDQTGVTLYNSLKSISNAENLGVTSDVSSSLVASSNVTFSVTPEKIGERSDGVTLYILNCSDANSWWTTGYTSGSLVSDLYKLLSPFFVTTVFVQNTTQLGQLLNGTTLSGEKLQNAVVINPFGEAVPIPGGYYSSVGVGYDPLQSSYALYCYTLGQKVLQYNWTWVSIVGYPLYYVGNTAKFPNEQNGWGIYGMKQVGPAAFNAFLQGLDNQTYTFSSNSITGSPTDVMYLSSQTIDNCNYYGIYPAPYQTANRALPTSILSTYHLNVTTKIFDTIGNWNPGAVYRHEVTVNGTKFFQGGFLALGLTRTPDIRLTALGLLSDYKPRKYAADYTDYGTSRLVVLQLGLVGGV
ncbi:MAG: hypothetical protein N3D85_03730 [Candidatus Bathyarchaeota archaeon]|nr:hypothetical protein [Candidatus Bathyarchaeota archaeon]